MLGLTYACVACSRHQVNNPQIKSIKLQIMGSSIRFKNCGSLRAAQ